MKINNKQLALVLFVLSTTLILGSATNVFAAAPTSVEIESCLNDFDPDTNPCDTIDEWKSGNISTDATYFEGNAIPMRIEITDLDTTIEEHTIILGWDLTKEQGGIVNHVFDYLTTYDFTDDPHPCLVAHSDISDDVCAGWISTTYPTPEPVEFTTNSTVNDLPQPTTSWNNLDSIEEQSIFLFSPGGNLLDITEVVYLDEGDPSGEASNTEKAEVSIKFKTDNSHVILAFGMHVASPFDWDHTAGEVSGQPVQVRCEEYNGKTCGHINFDSSVIVIVPDPTVTIEKQLIIDDGGLGETIDDFGLFVGTSGPVSSGTTVSISPNTDTPIGETGLSGYTRITGFAEGSSPECLDIVNLPSSTNITCIIENDDDPASITLDLSVSGGDETESDFTMTVNTIAVADGGSQNVAPHRHDWN
jgi:hypothetical protein